MANLSDFAYFSARVAAAQAMAERARLAKARAIHLEMAAHYQGRANQAARMICEPASSGAAA